MELPALAVREGAVQVELQTVQQAPLTPEAAAAAAEERGKAQPVVQALLLFATSAHNA
jgi:hypothetical protein